MLRATTLRNQPLLNGKHVFPYIYSRLNPMTPLTKKLDYDKSRRKHQMQTTMCIWWRYQMQATKSIAFKKVMTVLQFSKIQNKNSLNF